MEVPSVIVQWALPGRSEFSARLSADSPFVVHQISLAQTFDATRGDLCLLCRYTVRCCAESDIHMYIHKYHQLMTLVDALFHSQLDPLFFTVSLLFPFFLTFFTLPECLMLSKPKKLFYPSAAVPDSVEPGEYSNIQSEAACEIDSIMRFFSRKIGIK